MRDGKTTALLQPLQKVCLRVVASVTIVSHGAEIHEAVRSGDLSHVRSLLTSDAPLAWLPNTNDVTLELPLHIATEYGRTNILLYLLERQAPIEATNRWGQTALHRAICVENQSGPAGALASVRVLLANGAEVNAQDQTRQTPLHYAAGGGQLELAKVLLEHGAQVNAGDGRDNGTPLIQAAKYGQERMIELLISNQADKEAVGHDQATALSVAAYFGQTGAMRVLLEHGAKIDAVDENKVTALQYAVERGRTNAVELLLQHRANVDLEDVHGQTALGRCLTHRKQAFSGAIAALLRMYGAKETGSDKWRSGIHEAAGTGRIDKVRELLEGNLAFVNATDTLFGETPLHAAARSGQVLVAEFLLTSGADINARDSGGFTPLHNGVRSGGSEMVKLLLARKANPNAIDAGRRTPLHHASLGTNQAVVALLITAGAQVSAKDRDGLTALDIAKTMDHQGVVEVLSKSKMQ